MPLDFPSSPTVGQQYLNWTWNGVAWVVTPGPPLASLAQMGQNAGRNYLDNALFAVAQRGAGPWTTAPSFTYDRWEIFANLDAFSVRGVNITDTQRAQIGDELATAGLQNNFTGNNGAAAYSVLQQHIENIRRLAGKTITVSFWAVATAPISIGVSVDQYFGSGGSPSATVNGNGVAVPINATFARYQVTFNVPSAAGKTIGTNGDNYTSINFWYSSGSSTAARAAIGVQSGVITLWGMQVEVGNQATPLEKLVPEVDLARCQRFFQNWGAFAFAVTSGASGNPVFPSNAPVSPPMRASPTVSVGTVTYSGPANSLSVVGAPTYLGANMIVTAVSTNVYASCGPLTLSADL